MGGVKWRGGRGSGGWVAGQPPGCRNSGQKAEKEPENKKLAGRICGQILAVQYFAEKGPKKFFDRISFFYSNAKHSETITKFNLQYC